MDNDKDISFDLTAGFSNVALCYNQMNTGLLLNYIFFAHRFRSFKIFNSNGCESRLDAGSVLFERERRTFSQYYYAECVHSYFPRRLRSIQYTVNETKINMDHEQTLSACTICTFFFIFQDIPNVIVPDEFKIIPLGSTSLFIAHGEL